MPKSTTVILILLLVPGASLSARDARPLVAAIRANYEQLSPFRATIARQIEVNGKGIVSRQSIHSLGDSNSFRCSLQDGKLNFEFYRRDDVWYRYTPDTKSYVICGIGDMPSLLPLDPREAGAPNLQSPLATFLLQPGVSVESNTQGTIATLEGPSKDEADVWKLRFNHAESALPLNSDVYFDHTRYLHVEISYQNANNGASFPSEIKYTFFGSDDGKWTQRVIDSVTLVAYGSSVSSHDIKPPEIPSDATVSMIPVDRGRTSWISIMAISGITVSCVATLIFFFARHRR